MENNVSKRIKLLIGAVLVLFLTMAVMDFVSGFSNGLEEFRRGYEAGQSEARGMLGSPDSLWGSHHFVKLEPVDMDAAVLRFAGGEEFTSFDSVGELVVPMHAKDGRFLPKLLLILFSLVVLAATVTFIIHFIGFALHFPRRRVMDVENIISLRRIAASLGAIGLSEYVLSMSEYLWLRSHVSLEGYIVSMPLPPVSLIVALILWAMTEILNLAGKLQNEQELTI